MIDKDFARFGFRGWRLEVLGTEGVSGFGVYA